MMRWLFPARPEQRDPAECSQQFEQRHFAFSMREDHVGRAITGANANPGGRAFFMHCQAAAISDFEL